VFKNLFQKRRAKDAEESSFAPLPVAVAALLLEAAKADEKYEEREQDIIFQSLAVRFDLSTEDTARLLEEAERLQENAADIHRFTRHAKTMTKKDKLALVECLWAVVLSDGERDPHEDTLIRRICGLIYVEDRESGQARLRAEAALAQG
jgi:uncharacterized tellurite resistance protein B-like protein